MRHGLEGQSGRFGDAKIVGKSARHAGWSAVDDVINRRFRHIQIAGVVKSDSVGIIQPGGKSALGSIRCNFNNIVSCLAGHKQIALAVKGPSGPLNPEAKLLMSPLGEIP